MNRRPDYIRVVPPSQPMALKPVRIATPPRRIAQMPNLPLSNRTWRSWAGFLLANRDQLLEKDERHLRVCIMQRSYLTKAQIRWIFDIVARFEPAACGTWGATV